VQSSIRHAHHCPVAPVAGGLIDPSWCFEAFADRLARLPAITSEADVLCPEFLLAEVGPLTVRYCPFDHVNLRAKVVVIGITPGLHQMFVSCCAAQQALADGLDGDDVLQRASRAGSFAGSMRKNLVVMLDGLGVQDALGIGSTSELFGSRSELLQSTSALIYPLFFKRRNYRGSPNPVTFPLLRAFVQQVLTRELANFRRAHRALGRTVAAIVREAVGPESRVGRRCLFDFPHPSGANGHRTRQYKTHREAMTAQVAAWAQPGDADLGSPTQSKF
jgi:hypothetical protein